MVIYKIHLWSCTLSFYFPFIDSIPHIRCAYSPTLLSAENIPDLAIFAKEQGINYKILKIHNPWLRDKKLTNTSGKKYEIEIPTSGY